MAPVRGISTGLCTLCTGCSRPKFSSNRIFLFVILVFNTLLSRIHLAVSLTRHDQGGEFEFALTKPKSYLRVHLTCLLLVQTIRTHINIAVSHQ